MNNEYREYHLFTICVYLIYELFSCTSSFLILDTELSTKHNFKLVNSRKVGILEEFLQVVSMSTHFLCSRPDINFVYPTSGLTAAGIIL